MAAVPPGGSGVCDVFDSDALLSHGFVAGRRLALDIAEHALKAVDPCGAVLRRLQLDGGWMRLDDDVYDLDSYEHIFVVGGGKACYPQGLALERLLGLRIAEGFISVKQGSSRRSSNASAA
jgi:glycerate-2-kinase